MQLRCGSARYLQSCGAASAPHHFRHRSSKVEFNLAAIPPHLCRGNPRQKCSGQQGHSRPGCWRRQSPDKPALDCAGGTVPGLTATSLLPSFQQWAVPAQAPEAVCPPTPSVFVGVWEPKVSQPLRRQSPPAPTTSRPPPGPRFTRFARSAPYGAGRLTAAAHIPTHTPGSCETASTIGPQETHAPTASRKGTSCPARWGRKWYKYILQ